MLFRSEEILINIIKKGLGYNFYRHNVYGVISDIDLAWCFGKTKKGKIKFYIWLIFQKVIRKMYFLLIFLRLIINYYIITFMILQQIILIYFLVNKYLILNFFLLLIIILSKFLLYLTDYTEMIFKHNLKTYLNIDYNQKIKPTINNCWIIMFFSIRGLEEHEKDRKSVV